MTIGLTTVAGEIDLIFSSFTIACFVGSPTIMKITIIKIPSPFRRNINLRNFLLEAYTLLGTQLRLHFFDALFQIVFKGV